MPSYLYRCKKTGRELVLIRPVDRRDDPVEESPGHEYERVTVPESITIGGSAPDPFDMRTQVLRGWQKEEERQGARFNPEWSPAQIKKIWSED